MCVKKGRYKSIHHISVCTCRGRETGRLYMNYTCMHMFMYICRAFYG